MSTEQTEVLALTGDTLDAAARLYGVRREPGEDDKSLRTRVRHALLQGKTR